MDGDGFNDKFEKMVLFCKKNHKDISDKISRAEDDLQSINGRIAKHENFARQIEDIQYKIKQFTTDIEIRIKIKGDDEV